MANDDAPRGFWPIRHLTGGMVRTNEYSIAASFTTAIYQGDLVKLVAGGGVEGAAAGARLVGVFQGVNYTSPTGEQVYSKYWPGTASCTNIVATVADDPMTIFGVQSAGSTVAVDIGNLGDHVATTGDTVTGQSYQELNGTTSTAYAGFRVLGKIDAPGNAYGTNVDLEVQLVEHEYMPGNEATTPGVQEPKLMALNRAQFAKQLEPGLNTLFGLEYKQYPEQWRQIFDYNTSKKAFEEDVLLEGFGAAPSKGEGSSISYDAASEAWTSRYNHTTYAVAFAITEEAVEDGLYGSIANRYVKAQARSMAHTKEITGADVLNNAFDDTYTGGDGKEMLATDHPTRSGVQSNELATSADLSETSIEQLLINISNMKDERNIPIAAMGKTLIIPTALAFDADRILNSNARSGTAENDKNALQGIMPGGITVVQRLSDADAFFIKTDVPDGMKMFQRRTMKKGMDPDFETGNMRYKCSERYSFGWTDWRGIFGSSGA